MKYTSKLLFGASLLILSACQGADTESVVNKVKESTSEMVETVTVESDINTRLNAWFAAYDDTRMRRYPEMLAARGIKERMDEWNDMSKTFYLEEQARRRAAVTELKATFDRDALNAQGQLSYDIFLDQADRSFEGERWYDHQYPFNQMFGVHSSIPTFLLNNHRIDTVADAEAYVARLEKVGGKLDPVIEMSANSFDKGIAPPKFVYAHVIRDIDNIMSGAPFDDSETTNLMLNNLQEKAAKLGMSDDAKDALFSAATTALLENVAPAYARLRAELVRQQAAATTDDGAWKLPDGEAFYAYRLRQMTTTDMSPTEIHDLGLSEVARIHDEMREIMKKVEFEGTLKDFFEFMRTDPQFYYLDEGGRERYLKEATEYIEIMKTKVDDFFLTKPKAKMEVRAVEAFREQSAGKAFYSRPSLDGSRPGYYYANLYRMEDMPTYQMEALAYHEGIPGHHFQIAISQELEGVPNFRKFGRYTPHTEGWGLYTEYLPKEMGFYQDPYSDFGRLAMELWRAARLVVDTGLHDKKWTREKAIQYLVENTPNPEGDCIKAIERYIVMPAQATAYKVGMNEILRLRAVAEAELGDKYDIREFHDVILTNGPMPLNMLADQVAAYIAETKAG